MLLIGRDLNSRDIPTIKFLLKDHFSRGELEKTDGALQLFELMEKRDLVNDNDQTFLVHLLAASNNRKLARQLNNNVAIATTDPLSTLDAWRVAMVKCSDGIGEKNLGDLKFGLQGTTDGLGT